VFHPPYPPGVGTPRWKTGLNAEGGSAARSDVFDGVEVSHLRAVQTAIEAGRWRESSQAKDWAGLAVASVMGLDVANKAHKAKIAGLLKTWIANGMLVVVEGEDGQRKKRLFVEVGTAADDLTEKEE
jgi:hypothetical protein